MGRQAGWSDGVNLMRREGKSCANGLRLKTGTPVEIPVLIWRSGVEDGPGAGGEFAGDGAVGLHVGVASFGAEFPVVGGEGGVAAAGDVGGLVVGEPQRRGSFFGDRPRGGFGET